jgi:hypothetical protein
LLYWLPLPRTLVSTGELWLFTTVSVQLLFVISCNISTKESWSTAVIIIEAFCMLFNVTYFLTGQLLADYHAQIMLSALIIELLIITISIQGARIGRANSLSAPIFNCPVWSERSVVLNLGCSKEALS